MKHLKEYTHKKIKGIKISKKKRKTQNNHVVCRWRWSGTRRRRNPIKNNLINCRQFRWGKEVSTLGTIAN